MPSEDYAPVVKGGLKLKGGAPTGIKKKKKKAKAIKDENAAREAVVKKALEDEDIKPQDRQQEVQGDLDLEELENLEASSEDKKTLHERQFEEVRRRRLRDRLEKEGSKTHKQKVEELNKYLSNLSEHHDMPRIGPG